MKFQEWLEKWLFMLEGGVPPNGVLRNFGAAQVWSKRKAYAKRCKPISVLVTLSGDNYIREKP